MDTVSKSKLKAKLLEYLRKVEKEKKPLVVSHARKPSVVIFPYSKKADSSIEELRGSVLLYKDPTAPVGLNEWETLK